MIFFRRKKLEPERRPNIQQLIEELLSVEKTVEEANAYKKNLELQLTTYFHDCNILYDHHLIQIRSNGNVTIAKIAWQAV